MTDNQISQSAKSHHTADPNEETIEWNFSVPPSAMRGKMQLLTIGGISVDGNWYGALGQYFVAWHKLVKYDKAKFNAVIQSYRESQQPLASYH